MKVKEFSKQLTILIAILVCWELTYLLGLYPPTLWPGPLQVAYAFWKSVTVGNVLPALANSLRVVFSGFAVSAALAFLTVFGMYFSATVRDLVNIGTSVLHPIPGVAWIPFAILWFGISPLATLFVIFLASFFPIVVNTWTGFTYASRRYLKVGSMLGLSKASMVYHILLPSSLSYSLSGLKIGFARAWRALIAAEMVMGIASKWTGLGAFIWQAQYWLLPTDVIVGMAFIGAIGLLIEEFVFKKIANLTVEKWGMKTL